MRILTLLLTCLTWAWLGIGHVQAQVESPTPAKAKQENAVPEEKNSYGGPKLDVPSGAAQLVIKFEDEDQWGNKRINPRMQCGRNGGDKPKSPRMFIEGVPERTSSLVVYVLNEPPSWDNHGLFRVMPAAKQTTDKAWVVPPLNSNQQMDKIPNRVKPYAGGNSWGYVYSAPCPTSGSWRYTVSVFALDESDKVVGHVKTLMGFAP